MIHDFSGDVCGGLTQGDLEALSKRGRSFGLMTKFIPDSAVHFRVMMCLQ